MGLGSYLKGIVTAALGRSAPASIAQGSLGYSAGGPVWLDAFHSKRPPTPPELVNAYKAVAYACIQLNANGLARVPLRLYATTGPKEARPRRAYRPLRLAEETRLRRMPSLARALAGAKQVDEVLDHDLIDALASPNPYFDGNLFLTYVAKSLDVIGACYLWPDRPRPAVACREIWPLLSQYVMPVRGTGGEIIRQYTYFGDTFTFDEIVRIRCLSIRDPYMSAYSPLHACFEQLGLGDYYTATVESIMKSGARPSLIVSSKDPLMNIGEDEARRFEVDINQRFAGGRAGHVWVMRNALNVDPIQFPPADLAGLQITEWQRLIVANCFDVPISLLQSEDSNRAVAKEGARQHQQLAIEPRCRLIAAALTHQLARPVEPRLFFAFDDPVEKEREIDAKIFDMKIKAGTLTINEVRAEDQLPPVEWGDEPWLPSSLVQPSQQAEDRELAATQAEHTMQAEDDAAAEPEPKPGDDASADDTAARNALLAAAGRVLEGLERRLAPRRGRGHSSGGSGRNGVASAEDPRRGRGGSARRQHLWSAEWGSDSEAIEGLVPTPAEEGSWNPADNWSRAAHLIPAANGLYGSDGERDDAHSLGLLGRGWEGDAGEAGPRPRRMERSRPAHAPADPASEPELLRGNEWDDDTQSQSRAGAAPAGAAGGDRGGWGFDPRAHEEGAEGLSVGEQVSSGDDRPDRDEPGGPHGEP